MSELFFVIFLNILNLNIFHYIQQLKFCYQHWSIAFRLIAISVYRLSRIFQRLTEFSVFINLNLYAVDTLRGGIDFCDIWKLSFASSEKYHGFFDGTTRIFTVHLATLRFSAGDTSTGKKSIQNWEKYLSQIFLIIFYNIILPIISAFPKYLTLTSLPNVPFFESSAQCIDVPLGRLRIARLAPNSGW